jgi:hypothetical protein
MNGKGDKRRPEDSSAYRANYDAIFAARAMIDAQPVPQHNRMARCPRCGGEIEQWQQDGRPTPAIRCITNGCTWWMK